MVRQAIHAMTEQEVGNLIVEVKELRGKVAVIDKELASIKGGWEPTLRGIDDKLAQLLQGDSAVCVRHAARLDAIEVKNQGYDDFTQRHAGTVKEIGIIWKVIRWQWVPMLAILSALAGFVFAHISNEGAILKKLDSLKVPVTIHTTGSTGHAPVERK